MVEFVVFFTFTLPLEVIAKIFKRRTNNKDIEQNVREGSDFGIKTSTQP